MASLQKLTYKVNFFDVLYMLLLLAPSGVAYFRHAVQYQVVLILIAILCSILLVVKDSFIIYKRYVIIVSAFFFLIVLNSVLFESIRYEIYIGFLIRVYIAYIIVYLLRDRFIEAYVEVMCIMSLVSLIAIFLLYSGVLQENILSAIGFVLQLNKGIESYDYSVVPILRNSGPFWEPGAFGGYLLIGLAFNMLLLNDDFKSYKSIILIIGAISTQSTTTYIGLAYVLMASYLIKNKYNIGAYLFSVFLIFIVNVLFENMPIIGKKIYYQYQQFYDYIYGYSNVWNSQRLISTYSDFMVFLKYPLFGVGLSDHTRWNIHDYVEGAISTNGWMNFLVRWGIVGFVIYFVAMYKSFKKMTYDKFASKNTPLILLFFVLLIGTSQDYFYLPFFWSMTIYGTMAHSGNRRDFFAK